jgi:hypothetical protein
VCAIQIAGSCFLLCFELLNSPLQSFNPGFHVLVDLGGISIIKFTRSVLPHVASDDHYQSVTQSRKWTNCPSTKVEANRTTSLSAAVTEESHLLRALHRVAAHCFVRRNAIFVIPKNFAARYCLLKNSTAVCYSECQRYSAEKICPHFRKPCLKMTAQSADDPPVCLCGGRDARSPLERLDDPPTELFKTNIGGTSE